MIARSGLLATLILILSTTTETTVAIFFSFKFFSLLLHNRSSCGRLFRG